MGQSGSLWPPGDSLQVWRPVLDTQFDLSLVGTAEIDELLKKFINDLWVDRFINSTHDCDITGTEGGLSIDTFDSFGPTRRTLRQFIAGCGELGAIIRDFMLPEW